MSWSAALDGFKAFSGWLGHWFGLDRGNVFGQLPIAGIPLGFRKLFLTEGHQFLPESIEGGLVA
jgi:hypothetical protein